MSCCGSKRSQLTSAGPMRPASDVRRQTAPSPARLSPQAPPAPVIFDYLGPTAVTAMGPVTQRLYRFDGPRARMAVDARDAPSIAAVPNLRRLR